MGHQRNILRKFCKNNKIYYDELETSQDLKFKLESKGYNPDKIIKEHDNNRQCCGDKGYKR